MRIYLVRHGETVWNRENRTQGWTDIELNASGHRHAATIGHALREVPVTGVYSSTLARAVATARAIALHHGLEVVEDPDLRELNQGSLDGLTMEELRGGHAALLEEWRAKASAVCMPDGESMCDLQHRAWAAIRRIVAAHPRGTVAVVSHNLAIVSVLCRVMGIHLDSFRRIRQDVAAINVLEFDGQTTGHIVRMNDTAHVALGRRVAELMADLRDASGFAPIEVPDEDLAQVAAAGQAATGAEQECRVAVIVGQDLDRLKAAACGVPGWIEALKSAPAALAILTGHKTGNAVEATVLALRASASALGYGTLRITGTALEFCGVPIAGRFPSQGVAALLAVGIAQHNR